ncbi:hypothetical protein QE418_000594 [Microbacterium testaceum]|uniref:hypothetical protein n=1 Tax=Microbacterium TaxID=33882 RepID=UPI00277FA8CA|nr:MULTISPECIES: hypothetical protein [Microbacterium]MDQ1111146.1 hypothetical protein [Microbacterium testaceum]MDR6098315.1 hypothetical protein [Microbacterium sp. SORGH_AS_0454]
MPFDKPDWADGDPSKPVTAEKLQRLGEQYDTVAVDADQPDTPVGAAVTRAIAAAGAYGGYTDNGDGTVTLNPGTFTDNGDGTISLGG